VTALSVTVSDPVLVPATVGVNVKVMLQVAPAATAAPQLFVWAKSPVATMPVTVSAVLWLFVTETVFATLVVPIAWDPKLRADGASVTGTVPVPDRLETTGFEGVS
jgi:hypothetical protein